ncbi:hypothetical protein F443_20928 [Phytophthora nicotianae P1569]|uniref:Ubiquitin-like protease family profile domain-containing protein n=1 Tax=Phytophthora nicotianae P1569 TaxID=1317065 RepID=V9DZB7_PHYNI|nr:hypothetical protein F443_20928 [Phytophthora nicotianae P1569]
MNQALAKRVTELEKQQAQSDGSMLVSMPRSEPGTAGEVAGNTSSHTVAYAKPRVVALRRLQNGQPQSGLSGMPRRRGSGMSARIGKRNQCTSKFGDCKTGHDDEEDSTSDDAEFDEDEDEEEDESDDDDVDGSEAEDDDDYDDDPEPDESGDDGPFADDRDEESEVEYARQNQRTKVVTGSKPIASRRQRDLLAKRSGAVFSFTVRNLDTSTLREERSVKVFKDDIMTLKPFGWLSYVVIDYAIYKCMESTAGTVKLFSASPVSQIKQAKSGGESSFSDVKKLVDKIDWDLYFAVLFPVWGDNYWRLLVVEVPAKPSRRMFHVDSCVEIHESSHVFSIATKLLAAVCEVTSDGSPTVSVCETHPQQKKNNSDCGIYMLYYMEKIAVYLSQNKTKSIQSEIKKLTSGLNIGRSDKFHIKMNQRPNNLTGTSN